MPAKARKPNPKKLKQVNDGDIKIRIGAGAMFTGELPPHKELCIMEATSYILGYDRITDAPPCTSKVIRDLMITINDSEYSDRRRAQLKRVIPDIINTAPTRWTTAGVGGYPYPHLVTDERNRDYLLAEVKRAKMVRNAGLYDYYDNGASRFMKQSMPKILDFIRELANVAHFDGPDPDPE